MGKKGHPLLIPSELISSILEYTGDGGLKAALNEAGAETRLVSTDNEGAVLDMDNPNDYKDILLLTDGNTLSSNMFDRYNRVILVRHGEIAQHSGKILLGQTDVPLSKTGRKEAAAAASALESLGLDSNCRIIASDLQRTAQTADIIQERLRVQEGADDSYSIEFDSGLREIDLGSWDGRFKDELENEFPDEYARRGADILTWKASGGENYYDMRYRVLRTLRRMLTAGNAREEGGDLLIVTHAGPIMGIISAYTRRPLGEVLPKRITRCIPLHLDGSPW
jgi:probable phosphoglycerate mutase